MADYDVSKLPKELVNKQDHIVENPPVRTITSAGTPIGSHREVTILTTNQTQNTETIGTTANSVIKKERPGPKGNIKSKRFSRNSSSDFKTLLKSSSIETLNTPGSTITIKRKGSDIVKKEIAKTSESEIQKLIDEAKDTTTTTTIDKKRAIVREIKRSQIDNPKWKNFANDVKFQDNIREMQETEKTFFNDIGNLHNDINTFLNAINNVSCK